MISDKAILLLENKQEEERKKERDRMISIQCFDKGICPNCGSTNLIKTHINTFKDNMGCGDIFFKREYKLECEKCGTSTIIWGGLFQKKRKRSFFSLGGARIYDGNIECIEGSIC